MNLSSLFAPETVQTLGWTLVHFLWQGVALAFLLYLAQSVCRSASSRYAAALSVLGLMVIAPVATFLFLSRGTDLAAVTPGLKNAVGVVQSFADSPLSIPVDSDHSLRVNWLACLVGLWLVGVLAFSTRALGGWLVIERLRREKTELASGLRSLCIGLQQRLGIERTIGYFQSHLIDAPGVVGWFRPIVLLPITAITGLSPEQLEAVIAHELAHIKRFDCFVNLFQIAVETVLFYHPAVWWVNRCIRTERENCCDDWAVQISGNAYEYAKALAEMEAWRAVPAMLVAANGGSLKSRVSRLLGLPAITTGVPRAGLAVIGVACAVTVLFAGTRLTGSVEQISSVDSDAPVASQSEIVPDTPTPPQTAPAPEPEPQHVSVSPSIAPPPPQVPAHKEMEQDIDDESDANTIIVRLEQTVEGTGPSNIQRSVIRSVERSLRASRVTHVAPAAFAIAESEPPSPPAPPASDQESKGSYIGDMESLGYKNLTIDQIIALKIQGVTPQYVREIRAAGLDAKVNDLIALKVQGVDPAWIRDIRSTGLNPSLSELVAMRVQDVSSDYVRQAVAHGFKDVTPSQIIEMRVQDVHPADAEKYRQLGLKDVNLHQLIAMAVQEVTPEYVRAMQSAGFRSESSHDYIAAKVQGVDIDFVQKLRSHGFTNLTLHQLIALKTAGVF